MGLKSAIEDKRFDTRVRDKLLADGKLTQEELENYLKTLPDDAANGTMVELSTPRKPA